MNSRKTLWRVVDGLTALLVCSGASATAVDVSQPREGVPPNIVTSANKPMIMLAASKDHTLFGPVYTDFEDLDGDGVIDTTFKPNFKYYGYFDATKCYAYENSIFVPKAMATQTEVTTNSVKSIKFSCSATASHWSGNFLNWATMTRLDTVRKMLYGGFRSEDASGSTTLMGARLVQDAHSFVKYYKGDDIRDYTPFSTTDLIKTTGANANVYAGLSMCITGSSENPASSEPTIRMVKGNVRFWSTVEVQLCRWRDNPDNYSLGTFGPKLARFYSDADKGNGGVKHEEKIPSRTADGASYSNIGPDLNIKVKACDKDWLGDERCKAYTASNGTLSYKPYGLLQEFGHPSTSDAAARVEFGLITGSYDNNHTAGALRKNIRDLDDEINRSNGVFCHSASSGCAATLADGRKTGIGAIKAFDSIILFGRNGTSYGSGNTPSKSGDGNLPAWGNPVGEMVVQALQYYANTTSTNPSSKTNDNTAGLPVATWSDPLANSDARSKYGNSICRPLNILAFSSNALSFDGQANAPFATLSNRSGDLYSYVDKIGDAEGLTNTLRSVGATPIIIPANGPGLTSADDTNSCSAKTVGKLSAVNGICPEAPAMGGTYQVAGAALYGNTAKIRTVSNPPADLGTVENALKVRTMAASLTGGSPRIDVLIPGSNPKKYVYITPESVQAGGNVSAPLTFASISSGPRYGAFIVTWNDILMGGDYDMDITGFLRYDLTENADSPSGWNITITTDIPGVCGGSAGTHGFSVIGVQSAGSGGNGRYLTHQHNSSGTLSSMPATSEYLCGDSNYRKRTIGGKAYADTVCNVTGDGTVTFSDNTKMNLSAYCTVKNSDYLVPTTFKMVGETDALIKDPLWYAAKYGYFRSSEKLSDGTYRTLSMPPDQASWDSLGSDGNSGADGVPDGYFLARRPELLESQLRRVFEAAAKDSNAAPAISSSQLVTGSYKYVAKFDGATYSGALEAYKIDADGNVANTYSWEAGVLLKSASVGNRRSIITNSGNVNNAGTAFRWDSLSDDYKAQMTTLSVNKLSTDNAKLALNYVRGDQSLEGASGLRQRGDGLLGSIVNGTPWIQGRPSARILGDAEYTKFYSDNRNRKQLLWVAANDGMLHGLDAENGSELLAYVPGTLANRLADLPLQRDTSSRTKINNVNFTKDDAERLPQGTVWPYVDGNPFTADVKVTSGSKSAWKTYAFSTLGRGGRAVFALDVTDPSTFSESSAASIFKWQFTSDDDADLGYITGDVGIHPNSNQATPVAKMNNGKYALILGNGNKSTNGKAVLYILFMDGPSGGSWADRLVKIEADAGTGNGLSMPRWEDYDGDGTADVIYAGDLKGNMWKFDVSNVSSSNWGVAYKSASSSNLPLFRAQYTTGTGSNATTVQLPITTAPQTMYMGRGGLLVTFGTGNAFETGDFPATNITQRIYGIWDRPGMPASRGLPAWSGNTLVTRTYTRDSAGNVYVSSDGTALDWSQHDGWVMSLPGTAEAVLSDPSLDAGVLTLVGVRPKSGSNLCSDTPSTTLYTIDPISGRPERNVQGSLVVGSKTMIVAGKDIGDQKVRVVNDRSKKPFTKTCKAGEPGCTCTGSTCEKASPTCGPGMGAKRVVGRNADAIMCFSSSPRMQWRDVPGLRTNQ